MWPFLVVVSPPSLQLFRRIRKGEEPVLVQKRGLRSKRTIALTQWAFENIM